MKRLKPVFSDPPLLDELPAEANTQYGHASVFPQMIELRLATGQGSSESDVVLIADLWIGEGIIYDPTSHTEVGIWFSQGFLHLDAGNYAIKSGTRFGDRRAPETATVSATTTLSRKDTSSAGAGASIGVTPTQFSGSMNLEGRMGRESSKQATVTTKREFSGTQHVAASGNFWEVKPVGRDLADPASIEEGASRFKYIDTSDRLCDLSSNGREGISHIQASFCVYPSALRYRINSPGQVSILKKMMPINKSRVIDLLLRKGAVTTPDLGVCLAQAWIVKNSSDIEALK